MNRLFDTHCHFDSLDEARLQLTRAYEAGVRAINIIGTDVATTKLSLDVISLINEERDTLGISGLDAQATVGLHPHEAKHFDDQHDELLKLFVEHRDVISGIGETGYDFYYNHSEQNEQTRAFIWQIELAKEYGKTMVVHTRDAWDETFRLLEDQGWPEKTVLHCFTGGPEEALRCVENSAYISISGIATFKNAQDIREAIEVVPLNRLLCETDAPWLAPVPYRGRGNEPAYVEHVVNQIVDIRVKQCSNTEQEVVDALYENAIRVFR